MTSVQSADSGYSRSGATLPIIVTLILLSSALLTIISATSDTRNEVSAGISAGPSLNQTLTLHMHYDNVSGDTQDTMNTYGPYPAAVLDYDGAAFTIGYAIEKQGSANQLFFVMVPSAPLGINISGDVDFDFWASIGGTTDNYSATMALTLYDSADLVPGGDVAIGSNSVTNPWPIAWTLHNITISNIVYSLPSGHTLILLFERTSGGPSGHPLYVNYDQNGVDSTLSIPTLSRLNVTESGSYGFDATPKTGFGNQETIWAFANVTDAVGVYDLKTATLVVKNATSLSTVVTENMQVSSSGPIANPYWNLYRESFGPLATGSYIINITVEDCSGNLFWTSWVIEVIAIDHFNVVASTNKVGAGIPFDLTVEAADSGDNRIENWSGQIHLDAIDDATGLPISSLANSTILMSLSDKGIVTISENFTIAPKNITVLATNGSIDGESQLIAITPGPVVILTVEPASAEVPAGANIQFTANGTDRYGNRNDTWQPYWYLENPANGTLTPSGMTVQLHTVLAGKISLTCRDNVTDKNFTVDINVTTSGLVSIVVTPTSTTIWEGNTTSIIAMGYDEFGNQLSITSAIWTAEGFSSAFINGGGSSGLLFSGKVPESGLVRVTMGSVIGTVQINIIAPPNAPSLGALPNQVGYEDTPWSVDLSIYWKDSDGTAGLTWYVTDVNDSLMIVSHDMASASIISFIPQPNANGADVVFFWVRDPTGYTNFKQITITVLPVNDAPAFINEPPTEIYVKFDLAYSFNYTYYVEDVDNPMSQLVITASPGTDITSAGLVVTFDFPDLNSGVQYSRIITLNVSDGSLSDSLAINVIATTDTPPDLTEPLPDITIMEGDMNVKVFDLDNYFVDVDGDVIFYSEGFKNVEVQINSTTHEVFISAPGEWSGQTDAVFIAHDPTGAIRIDTITITVIAVNDPPVIEQIPHVFVHHSVTYWIDLRLYVFDPDNDFSELTIETSDSGNITYNPAPYAHLELNYPANVSGGATYLGPYDVAVQLLVVDSGGLEDSISFLITVSDDYPPTFQGTPPEIISFLEDSYLDKPNSLDIISLFTDIDDAVLNYTFYGNKNVSVAIGNDGWMNFSSKPNWYGTEYIIFNVTDPHGAWLSFRLRVDVIPVNDAPVLTQIPDIEHYGGRQWSLDISDYINDVDDPNLLQIEIFVVQPVYVRAVGTTLYFEFPEDVDIATVMIYVFDGQANSNMITFTVSIKKTLSEVLPWPLIAAILAVGIIGYLMVLRFLPNDLQEIFLIHNDGRMISHSGKEAKAGTDQDVVSAMFTAVQEFIKDSFKEEGETLKKMEMGDRKIVIEKGKWIYAAMIYTGWPHNSILKNLSFFVADIEGSYGSGIEHWDGTLKSLPGIEQASQEMLEKKYRSGDIEEIRGEKKTADG